MQAKVLVSFLLFTPFSFLQLFPPTKKGNDAQKSSRYAKTTLRIREKELRQII